MTSSRIANRWQATLALLGCLGAASAWGQNQPNQTLDQVDAFDSANVLEMLFDRQDPAGMPDFNPLDLGSPAGLSACKLASSGLYCLANGPAGRVVRQWVLPLSGVGGSPVNRLSCADPALNLEGGTCTGLTVDMSGAIWVSGKKGSNYSLVKAVKQAALPNGCTDGWAQVTSAPSTTPLCAREFASGPGVLSDLDAVDGEVAYPPTLPIGPGLLALNVNGTGSDVRYFALSTPGQAPLVLNNWGLAAGERLLSTTLLQRKNGQNQVIGNSILAATTAHRILSVDVTSPTSQATKVGAIKFPNPIDPDTIGYGIRTSFKTGRVYLSDRSARAVRALVPDAPVAGYQLIPLTPDSNGILYTTPAAPLGLTVAPGNSVDLADCKTTTCTVIPGAPGQPPSVTFDSVDLQDGSPTGVTVYQIRGLIDCRYAPVDCSNLLGVPPIGKAPFDDSEYMEGLIGAGIIIPLDPSKPALAKNRYRPAAQLLNVTPMLPEDVTSLFSESGGLPALQISRTYRAQRGTDPTKPFRFDALFYKTAEGQVFINTLFTDVEVNQLSSTFLGCNDNDPATTYPSPTYAQLLKLDVVTRVSERNRSVSDFFRAAQNDYRDTIINDGCGGSKGQAPELSLVPINLMIAPDTYGPQTTSNTQSVTENNDAVFARLVEALYDDLNRSRAQLACTTFDGGGAPPLASTDCNDLAGKWSTGKTLLNSCVSSAFSGESATTTNNCNAFRTELAVYGTTVGALSPNPLNDPANRIGEQVARVATLTRIFNERFVPSILPKGWCREKTAPNGYKGCPVPAFSNPTP